MSPSTASPSRPARVLVLGGSGFVGRALCERLSAAASPAGPHWQVRVPTRRAAMLRGLQTLPGVEVQLRPDIAQTTALEQAVAGCDAVVNLVAILHGDEAAFEAVHVQWPRQLAQACLNQGVTRLVHVSALGCAPDAPSRYLRSKARGEAALQAAEGLALTQLRPSVIFGAQDRFLNTFAALQALAPVVPLASADARFQPVWVADVAEAIARCLSRPETVGQTYEAVGPDVFTLADLVRLAGQASGHPRPIWPLPAALGRLQAGLMALAPGEPLMTPDNLDSMQVPNVASGQLPTLAALGIRPSPLAAVAPGYLAPGQRCARLDAWRRRHP